MKERPIIFSSEMVRAILERRKTITRRIVKPQPHPLPARAKQWNIAEGIWCWESNSGKTGIFTPDRFKCHYGSPGDRLWVREIWRVGSWAEEDGDIAVDYRADNFPGRKWIHIEDEDLFQRLWEESSEEAAEAGRKTDEDGKYHWEPGGSPCRWRPSIFMPRWASRITLEVNEVRVEQIQDISEEDAKAEGCEKAYPTFEDVWLKHEAGSFRGGFNALWNSIHGKDAWKLNPWVWIVSFKVLEIKGAKAG